MGAWRTVVGVVGDIKLHDLFETAHATIYTPLAQLSPSTIRRAAFALTVISRACQRRFGASFTMSRRTSRSGESTR
jgi:hypothetical protein